VPDSASGNLESQPAFLFINRVSRVHNYPLWGYWPGWSWLYQGWDDGVRTLRA
jgi:hypothetical protein